MGHETMFETELVRQSDPRHRMPVRLMNEPIAGTVIAFRRDHGLYSTMKRNYGTARVQIISVEPQMVNGVHGFLVKFEPQAA